MIVVDTNIIGYLYLSSERTEQAERALLKDAESIYYPQVRSVP